MKWLKETLLPRVQPLWARFSFPNGNGGMSRVARTALRFRGSSDLPDDLLDPSVLGKIGGLELIAKSVVDGVMSGKHRSTHKGGCSEFAEHRLYAQGDDIRLIDWRLYARSDRYYIKQFDDETNLRAWIVVDASASMQFGMSTVSKFDYARLAAACLARLLLRQRDSIGLMIDAGRQRKVIPPLPRANHFHALADTLRKARAGGPTTLSSMLHDLAGKLHRRGMVIVFSDCLCDLNDLTKSLHLLRLRGHDVLLFQIFAPEERSFEFRNPATFEDLEKIGRRLDVNPRAIRRRYIERVEAFMSELRANMARIDCDLVTMTTDRDLGDALAYYLHRRAASRKRAAATSG